MSDGIEVANAYVALTTKMPGVKKDAEAALGETEGVARSAGGLAGKAFGLALIAGLTAAAIGVTAVVGELFDVGSQIDEARDTIRVFTTDTGNDLAGLNDVVDEVAKETPAALSDIAKTVAVLHQRLGLTGDDLEQAARRYLDAGRLFGEQVDLQATTGLFNVFRIGSSDVSGALDTLFNAARVAGVGINDLSGTIATAAPTAQLLGLSFEETAGFLASLSKAGIDTNKIAATLGVAMSKLAKAGEEPADAFRRTLKELQSYVAAGEIAKAQNLAASVFGSRGASQFVAALQSGTLNLDDLAASVTGVGDTILGVSADTQDFAELWQVFQNQAMLALEPLASSVFNALGDALPSVTAALVDAEPALTEVAVGAAKLAPSLVKLAVEVLPPLVDVLTLITPLLVDWATSQASLWDVLSGFFDFLSGNITLRQFMSQVSATSGSVAEFYKAIANALAGVIGWFLNLGRQVTSVMTTITRAWSSAWSSVQSVVGAVWGRILATVQGGVNGILGLINSMLRAVNSVGGGFGIHVGLIPKVSFGGPKLAEGAFVPRTPGGVAAVIGEGQYDEVVQPLDGPQFDRLAEALASKLDHSDGGPLDLTDSTIDRLVRALAGYLRVQNRMGEA